MQNVQIHITDISHVTPLSKNYSVQLNRGSIPGSVEDLSGLPGVQIRLGAHPAP
jgi:hypothetical protein